MAQMKTGRYGHGCVINLYRDEIYVAGGYIAACTLTDSCEVYSISKNKWKQLPDLTEKKRTMSLCVLDSRFLYSLGGCRMTKNLATIELLDLDHLNQKWKKLVIDLQNLLTYTGAIPLNKDEILLFGGVNNVEKETSSMYILKKTAENHSINKLDTYV